MADYSLGLALGYGREKAGRVGTGVGFNAYKIFSGKYIETGATVRKTGETYTLACTQNHWSMEGRPAVREANLKEFLDEPNFAAEKFHGTEPPIVQSLYPNPLDEAKKTGAASMGHGRGFDGVRRLQHLRGRVPEREQHPDCRQGPGAARPRNALDAD